MVDQKLAVACATVALLCFPFVAHASCGDGVVDVGEQCDDGLTPSPCCSPACSFEPSTVECRPSIELCDPAESCTGASAECPPESPIPDIDADGVCDFEDDCPFVADPQQDPTLCDPKPLAKATEDEIQRFTVGLFEFTDIAFIADGLGPVFNGFSCALCHQRPMIGGTSPLSVTRFGRYVGGSFDPMTDFGGSLIQANGIDDGVCVVEGESVPPEATVSTQRITTPLFGAGLIGGISDEAILRYADAGDADGDGISGRPNMIAGLIGRFGWKAQMATLHEFAGDAFLNEMGITNPDFPNESSPQGGPVICDSVADPEDDGTKVAAATDFMTMLAPLTPLPRTKESASGRRMFRRIDCDACHVLKLKTGESSSRALHRRQARLFSDLLLHDMGPALADGIEQGEATANEFRTAPLWGAGRRSAFLHDGRAGTLMDAILAHGGEAQAARDRFAALDPGDRAAIVAFLSSL